MAVSRNSFFSPGSACNWGRKTLFKPARRLGFGSPTGIELDEERALPAGVIPPGSFETLKERWTPFDTITPASNRPARRFVTPFQHGPRYAWRSPNACLTSGSSTGSRTYGRTLNTVVTAHLQQLAHRQIL